MVGLHHRAVEQLQLSIDVTVLVVHGLTHDFPSVVVDEDHLGVEGRCNKTELAVGAVCS